MTGKIYSLKKIGWITFFVLIFYTFLFSVANAIGTEGYTPLASLPGFKDPTNLNTNDYINALYTLSITAASLLVVIKIILAGVKYMFSEVVPKKQEAKKDIQNALLGLLIILSAVLILNTINPDLKKIDFLSNAPKGSFTGKGNTSGNGNGVTPGICDVGECNTTACDYFDSVKSWGLVGYIPRLLGADLALNASSCLAWCTYLDGEIISGDSTSGQCRYSKDLESATQALMDLETQDLISKLPADSVPPGGKASTCVYQTNTTWSVQCAETTKKCIKGNMLPNNVKGTATQVTNTKGEQVIVCEPPIINSELQNKLENPTDPWYGAVSTISACDRSDTPTCEEVSNTCKSNPNYLAVQQTEPTALYCITRDNTQSDIDNDASSFSYTDINPDKEYNSGEIASFIERAKNSGAYLDDFAITSSSEYQVSSYCESKYGTDSKNLIIRAIPPSSDKALCYK